MIRSEYEARVAAAFGGVVAAYGFTLTPQPPGDIEEPWSQAIFETDPPTFERRLPGLASHISSDVTCVDVTVEWHPPRLTVQVEGFDLDELAELTGVPGPTLAGDLDTRLALAAGALRQMLAVLV